MCHQNSSVKLLLPSARGTQRLSVPFAHKGTSPGLVTQGVPRRGSMTEHAFFYTRAACLRSELHPSQRMVRPADACEERVALVRSLNVASPQEPQKCFVAATLAVHRLQRTVYIAILNRDDTRNRHHPPWLKHCFFLPQRFVVEPVRATAVRGDRPSHDTVHVPRSLSRDCFLSFWGGGRCWRSSCMSHTSFPRFRW